MFQSSRTFRTVANFRNGKLRSKGSDRFKTPGSRDAHGCKQASKQARLRAAEDPGGMRKRDPGYRHVVVFHSYELIPISYILPHPRGTPGGKPQRLTARAKIARARPDRFWPGEALFDLSVCPCVVPERRPKFGSALGKSPAQKLWLRFRMALFL